MATINNLNRAFLPGQKDEFFATLNAARSAPWQEKLSDEQSSTQPFLDMMTTRLSSARDLSLKGTLSEIYDKTANRTGIIISNRIAVIPASFAKHIENESIQAWMNGNVYPYEDRSIDDRLNGITIKFGFVRAYEDADSNFDARSMIMGYLALPDSVLSEISETLTLEERNKIFKTLIDMQELANHDYDHFMTLSNFPLKYLKPNANSSINALDLTRSTEHFRNMRHSLRQVFDPRKSFQDVMELSSSVRHKRNIDLSEDGRANIRSLCDNYANIMSKIGDGLSPQSQKTLLAAFLVPLQKLRPLDHEDCAAIRDILPEGDWHIHKFDCLHRTPEPHALAEMDALEAKYFDQLKKEIAADEPVAA